MPNLKSKVTFSDNSKKKKSQRDSGVKVLKGYEFLIVYHHYHGGKIDLIFLLIMLADILTLTGGASHSLVNKDQVLDANSSSFSSLSSISIGLDGDNQQV